MGYKNWDVGQFNIKHFHNSSDNSQKVILMLTLLIR